MLKVFYSYAHEDKMLRSFLEKHLATLKRQALITEWHDRDINAGKEWEKEIDANMNAADIILLLISPDFVHSDYCYGIEMKHALERHENGATRVVPIILRHGDYKGAPFSKLQTLPTNAVPVVDRNWHNRDEAFSNVAQSIRAVVEDLQSNQWLSEGNIHFFRQQYHDALEAFDRAIYFNPNNALAHLGRGQTFIQLVSPGPGVEVTEGYEKAQTAFSQAISLDSTNADAYIGKGQALLGKSQASSFWESEPHLSDKDGILDAFGLALRLDPENEAAYLGQGDTFTHFQNYEEAVEAYKKAIKYCDFPNRETYKKLGDTLQKLNRYEEAVEAYNVCINQNMQNADLYVAMGKALQELKRYEEALRSYDKALSFKPAYLAFPGEIYIYKGKILYLLVHTQEALEAFEKALSLLPNYEKAKRAEARRGKGNALQSLASWEFRTADDLDPPIKNTQTDHFDDLGELDEIDPF